MRSARTDSCDRADLNLKGPVSEVTTERTVGGRTITERRSFDRTGRLEHVWVRSGARETDWAVPRREDGVRLDRGVTAVRRPDGSWREEQHIGRMDAWNGRFVPDVGFGCRGADVAVSEIAPDGHPVRTVFKGASGIDLWTISYTVDEAGRVVEAVQRAGEGAWAEELRQMGDTSGMPDEAVPPFFTAGSEFSRVTLRYDVEGRLVERCHFVIGREAGRTEFVFGPTGDVVLIRHTQRDGSPPETVFTYPERDLHGNWTRQIGTRGRDVVSMERRSFVYFHDEP